MFYDEDFLFDEAESLLSEALIKVKTISERDKIIKMSESLDPTKVKNEDSSLQSTSKENKGFFSFFKKSNKQQLEETKNENINNELREVVPTENQPVQVIIK